MSNPENDQRDMSDLGSTLPAAAAGILETLYKPFMLIAVFNINKVEAGTGYLFVCLF